MLSRPDSDFVNLHSAERIPEPNLGPCDTPSEIRARRPDLGAYLLIGIAFVAYSLIVWAL